jgi:hypothetical protein
LVPEIGIAAAISGAWQWKWKGSAMTYREAADYLARHTRLVELTGENPEARVAICPEWQGRVMTSTCGGPEGPSFGFLHREFIEAGKLDPRFNNYGGEDRMWLSPEGGPFSLWFKSGQPQTLENWYTPAALNEGAFEVTSAANGPCCRLSRAMHFENASSTPIDVDVTRDVRLLGSGELEKLFGAAAIELVSWAGVRCVAYETVNTIVNRGAPLTRQRGLVSIWILGMLNCGPQTVVVVPYKPGDAGRLGPAVRSDYFGSVPPDRLKIAPEAILFRADGNWRSKIGTSQHRARNVLGSIDFQAGALTLVQFTMPDDPVRHPYMNNVWEINPDEPYVGDVANSFNDGPLSPGGKGLGPFYEIESLSPAVALETGQSLTHHHRTVHVQAEVSILDRLAEQTLGIGLENVRSAMAF